MRAPRSHTASSHPMAAPSTSSTTSIAIASSSPAFRSMRAASPARCRCSPSATMPRPRLRAVRRRPAALLGWNVGGRTELELVSLPGGKRTLLPAPAGRIGRHHRFLPAGRSRHLNISGSKQPSSAWQYEFASQRYTPIAPRRDAGCRPVDARAAGVAQVQGAGRVSSCPAGCTCRRGSSSPVPSC